MLSNFHIAVTACWSESEMLFNSISLLLNDWSFSSLFWLMLFYIRSVSNFHCWCIKSVFCQLWLMLLLLLLFIILICDSKLWDTFSVVLIWVNNADVVLSSWYFKSDWWDWFDLMRSTDFDETILKLFKFDRKVSTE